MSWSWAQPTARTSSTRPSCGRDGSTGLSISVNPVFEDRKKIISIHTRFMPLEGSSTRRDRKPDGAVQRGRNRRTGRKTWERQDSNCWTRSRHAITPAADKMPRSSGGARRRRLIEHAGREEPDLCRPCPGSLAADLAGDDRGICRFRSRSPLPGSRDARPPRGCQRSVTRRHFDEAQKKVHPTMNENLTGVLQQDPAALQGRASAEGAAAGVPVIFFSERSSDLEDEKNSSEFFDFRLVRRRMEVGICLP